MMKMTVFCKASVMGLTFFFLFLMIYFGGCSTTPPPMDSPPLESEEDDVIVKDAPESATFNKLVKRLYEGAYEDYLSGNYENAIIGFETAQILDPQKMEFWKKLALSYCYLATGRYREAQNLSKILIDQKPERWEAYLNAGLAALWQNQLAKAMKYFETADGFDDHEPMVNFYFGMTYDLRKNKRKAQQQFMTAERAYDQIVSKNPNDEQAYIELSYLLLYLNKDVDKVSALLKQVEGLVRESEDPEKKQVWLNFYLPHLKGIYFYRKGEFQQSILTLGDAIEKAPSGIRLDLAESYYYLGKNYQGLRDSVRAQKFFKKASDIDLLVPYAQDIRPTYGHSSTGN